MNSYALINFEIVKDDRIYRLSVPWTSSHEQVREALLEMIEESRKLEESIKQKMKEDNGNRPSANDTAS